MIITNQIIQIEHKTGENKYGEVIHGPPVQYEARVTDKIEEVKNQLGKEVISNMHFLLKGLVKVGYDDKITYINENGDVFVRKPLSYEPKRGLGGQTVYTKVYC
ncbi:hypothetical protein [Pseudobacillus badius]|uniref:hypothetical protein n=1 Tax=Bacillus badius TaxID=1455 RepID=UPI0024A2D34A|nr:hypothetical protein [Bacillus badius]GLY11413.1 hypothetical protein Bbad01_26290 [Bacillus badius]